MSWTVGHSGRPTTSADWYDDRETETSATERDWYARDGSASDTPDSFSAYGAHSAESDTHTETSATERDWYARDGSASDTSDSFSTYGAHSAESDTQREREIRPDAWADSHLMGGATPTEGEQRHSEGWHGTAGLLWDMDSVDSDSSSLFRAGSVDGSDAGPWSETERDRETESETSYPAELAVDWTVASSLHEPRAGESERVSEHAHTQSAVAVPGWTVQSSVPKPNRGLLTHPQQHPQTPGSPAPRVAPVITGPRPGQQKVAKKQKKKKQTKTKSPGVCPLCSRATYCDVQDAVTQNLDMHAPLDGKGRCKAREQPRKDNRLGSWYGYAGQPYCKGCSESFKSHLILQKTRARCGCVRSAPCVDCIKVLDGFKEMSHSDVFDKFDAEKSSRAGASAKNGGREYHSGPCPPRKLRKVLAGAALAVVLVGAIVLQIRSYCCTNGQSASSDTGLTQCVDDEDARAAANPFQDQPKQPFSKSCREIAKNGQCDLAAFVSLGVREFCCDSCKSVEPVWICPTVVTDFMGEDMRFDKDPRLNIPLNQAPWCASSPFAQALPCVLMSAGDTSDQLCFACTGVQALLHGASCPHDKDAIMPYGWTCRCDGCAGANSGQCVTPEALQEEINEYEQGMPEPAPPPPHPPRPEKQKK